MLPLWILYDVSSYGDSEQFLQLFYHKSGTQSNSLVSYGHEIGDVSALSMLGNILDIYYIKPNFS